MTPRQRVCAAISHRPVDRVPYCIGFTPDGKDQLIRGIRSCITSGSLALSHIEAALKERYGNHLTFWGGISTQQTLPFGSPEEVRTEARRVRDLLSQGSGHIFAPAQEIQGDVPAQNILALLEVAREMPA